MNEFGATNWVPGLVVLGVGAAITLLYLYLHFRKTQAASPQNRDETLANLERRAQILIEQLKELASDRHQLGEARFAAENARLEQEAAAAFRARDEYARGGRAKAAAAPVVSTAKAAAPAAAPKGFFGQHPQLSGAIWGGGVVLFFVVLGLVLTREEKPRMDSQPPTGARPPMAQGATEAQPPDEGKELQDAMARLAEHPDDLELAAKLGHEMIRLQRFDDAQRITEQSLGFDPFHVEHRIHRAVLRSAQGQSQQAIEELQHIAVTYPHSEEARLFLGGLRMEIGDRKGALDAFERYLAEAPPDEIPPQLPQVVGELKSMVASQAKP
jgi:tetratricopeptide (TPR) repeat protein